MLIPTYTLVVILLIFLPTLLAVLWRRRVAVPWLMFCVGMATFVGSQVYHLPLNDWLSDIGLIGPLAPDAANWGRTAVVLGLSAGLCEGIARAIGFAILWRFKQGRRWADGVMVGLGHGGIEAMLLGGVLLAATVAALLPLQGSDLSALGLEPEQIVAVERQLRFIDSPLYAFAPFVERMIAMTLHVVVSVMVWRAFARRNPLYFVVGVAYHSLVDTVAVALIVLDWPIWVIELVFAGLMVPGAVWLWQTRDRAQLAEAHRVTAVADEWRAFSSATRKELLQLWRTHRALVVWSVFLLFGLMSPLLAKFTPQILTMVEGAEQFADLIPEPTKADAMTQYIGNITQFGFIIAIVLGMGAVAGEKERGTAAIILSKPMSRWAFLMSKFTAQALLYSVAFLLAALATYYYTLVLFEPLPFAAFMFSSGLLWVWLLCFAAVTLLGSTLGNSSGAGAGLGLLGAVLILLLGSWPTVGTLAPGGLVSWAGQLGLGLDVPANTGALAGSVVLILVLILLSLSVFEAQEV